MWLELARCERELGVNRISEDALKQMEAAGHVEEGAGYTRVSQCA